MGEKPGDVMAGTGNTAQPIVSDLRDEPSCEQLTAQDEGDAIGAIRSRIECTEAKMAGTLNAIQERLSFDYLRQQAEETVLDLAEGRARAMLEKTGRMSGEWAHSITDMVKENPLPMALLGAGLGLLVMGAVRSQAGPDEGMEIPYYDESGALSEDLYQAGLEEPGVSDYRQGRSLDPENTTHGALDRIRSAVATRSRAARSAVADYAQKHREAERSDGHGIQRARERVSQLSSGDLLAMGLGALALGALFGAMFPRSGREQGMFQNARQTLMSKTRKYGQRAVEKVEKVVDTAREAAREEMQRQSVTAQEQS
jgi:hypothetical protein